MTVEFTRSMVLATDPMSAFDVSLDVDFHLESMADSGESVVGGVERGGMQLGDVVTWRARHFGVWWTMTSTITEFDRPHMFVDEQARGPVEEFRHVHRFVAVDGGTRMTDEVSFTAPLGPLGRIAERVALRSYVPKLIEIRNEELARYFDGRSEDPPTPG